MTLSGLNERPPQFGTVRRKFIRDAVVAAYFLVSPIVDHGRRRLRTVNLC